MKTIEFIIDKESIFTEVAKTSSYVGAKSQDESAYERILTTDENEEMLERFWNESISAVTSAVREFIDSKTVDENSFTLSLSVSDLFRDALKEDMLTSLSSFFVTSIVSQWFMIANKEEAQGYATMATSYLEDFSKKVYYKAPPRRPEQTT